MTRKFAWDVDAGDTVHIFHAWRTVESTEWVDNESRGRNVRLSLKGDEKNGIPAEVIHICPDSEMMVTG